MDMDVQMWNLLEGCGTDRMPQAQPLIGEDLADGTSDPDHRPHQLTAEVLVKLSNVAEVTSREDKNVTRVGLPQVD
jgi:hypothetical protein